MASWYGEPECISKSLRQFLNFYGYTYPPAAPCGDPDRNSTFCPKPYIHQLKLRELSKITSDIAELGILNDENCFYLRLPSFAAYSFGHSLPHRLCVSVCVSYIVNSAFFYLPCILVWNLPTGFSLEIFQANSLRVFRLFTLCHSSQVIYLLSSERQPRSHGYVKVPLISVVLAACFWPTFQDRVYYIFFYLYSWKHFLRENNLGNLICIWEIIMVSRK